MAVTLINKATGKKYSSSGTRATVSPAAEQEKPQKTTYTSPSGRVKLTVTEKNANYAALSGAQTQTSGKEKTATARSALSRDQRDSAVRKSYAARTAGVWSRVGNMLSGAGKGSAAGFTNSGGVTLEGLGKLGSFLQDKKDARQAAQDREYLALHEKELADALAAGDQEAAKWAQIKINQAKYRLKTSGDLGDYYDSVTQEAVGDIYQAADELAASSAQDIQEAKEGLGGVGQLVVDTGVAGTQLAGDVLLGALTGGGALPFMALRGFGSGAQTARLEGADFGQQVAYGAGSAALGVLTEKISNVAGPFKRAFGGGVLDEAAERAVEKLGGSALGRVAVSALGEGLEEVVEGALQPVLQRATYDPEAMANYNNPEYWTGLIYDGLIGAVLGGGGAVLAPSTWAKSPQNTAEDAAQARTASGEGNDTPAQQTGVQGVSEGAAEGVMEQEARRLFGQNKAAPEVGADDGYIYQEHHGNILDGIRAHLPEVESMEPVAHLTGQEFQRTAADTRNLRTKVIEFFNSIGNKVFRPNFGEITLNDAGARDSLAHGYGKIKAAAFAALPDVLKRGKIISYDPNYKGRDYESYLIAAPVKIGSDTGYVGAYVIKDVNTQRYKVHEVLMVDNEGAQSFKTETTENIRQRLRDNAPSEGTPTSTVNAATSATNTFTPKAIEPEVPTHNITQPESGVNAETPDAVPGGGAAAVGGGESGL